MADTGNLIDFDLIEEQKENIQALPSGRSAKKLADVFSPIASTRLSNGTIRRDNLKSINDNIRAEYENEVANIAESDDPLDVWDRYVRWILDAYPSAQATPQSQLHTVLERATKAFVSSAQYKNDPRYLKLWLHYIHFFADTPRETFIFLARHSIGERLALFYEEYAEWLEGTARRWNQAEEVYKLGIERDARPVQRLIRKFGEFEARRSAREDSETIDRPASPAIPAVRSALAAKIDPYASAAAIRDPQAPRAPSGVGGTAAPRAGRAKLQIFSDAADTKAPAMGAEGSELKGWDSIGSLADRKKENAMAPKPWAGETLAAGGKKSAAPKMSVFRDTTKPTIAKSLAIPAPSSYQVGVNPTTGRQERVHVDLSAVYPNPDDPTTEYSFEEIWAANRGWLDVTWEDAPQASETSKHQSFIDRENSPQPKFPQQFPQAQIVQLDENGRIPGRESKPRRKKTAEVNETQIIKAKLDSPTGPKMRKSSKVAEPTMTIHTRAATDDIYDIFNAPLAQPINDIDRPAEEDDYETDGDYTSGAESTTASQRAALSEVDEAETPDDEPALGEETDARSEWSEFSMQKHILDLGLGPVPIDDDEENAPSVESPEHEDLQISPDETSEEMPAEEDPLEADLIVITPKDDSTTSWTQTSMIPIPPEDYVHNPRPYRDPVDVANSRLPFMTPITERTESSFETQSRESTRFDAYKTPSRVTGQSMLLHNLEPMSSPVREVDEEPSPVRMLQPQFLEEPIPTQSAAKPAVIKGSIIKDLQCNPVDESVRHEVLSNMKTTLSSYPGFFDHREDAYGQGNEIRKYAKSVSSSRNSTDKTAGLAMPVTLSFADVSNTYTLKKKLGAGAFAPVYLVENSSPEPEENDAEAGAVMGKGSFSLAHDRRAALEALKMEHPPTPWEFHMMRLAHSRLGPQHRATASLSSALEMHLYRDEAFLFLPYHPHGTLLDVINIFRGEASGVMDEQLAMFFTIELFRTVEALHAKQMMHGDLKPDNCLLRLDDFGASTSSSASLSPQWSADGSGNWSSRGVTLIDFGRAIDFRAFEPDVQFIADWPVSAADCAEMREGRPWTWQIDYHGLAGIVHCLLFGKYIETVRCDTGGLCAVGGVNGRKYKIRESLKRWWQTEIWGECFEVLLNPRGFVEEEEGGRMPALKSMRRVRERMETWLEANCEKGVGLRALVGKVEGVAKARR